MKFSELKIGKRFRFGDGTWLFIKSGIESARRVNPKGDNTDYPCNLDCLVKESRYMFVPIPKSKVYLAIGIRDDFTWSITTNHADPDVVAAKLEKVDSVVPDQILLVANGLRHHQVQTSVPASTELIQFGPSILHHWNVEKDYD